MRFVKFTSLLFMLLVNAAAAEFNALPPDSPRYSQFQKSLCAVTLDQLSESGAQIMVLRQHGLSGLTPEAINTWANDYILETNLYQSMYKDYAYNCLKRKSP